MVRLESLLLALFFQKSKMARATIEIAAMVLPTAIPAVAPRDRPPAPSETGREVEVKDEGLLVVESGVAVAEG